MEWNGMKFKKWMRSVIFLISLIPFLSTHRITITICHKYDLIWLWDAIAFHRAVPKVDCHPLVVATQHHTEARNFF